ncbi:Hypothetical_protein [Hexamita inflata]|uniref:Hypothetical_protein n=1 Tax=Hexamita inflata TaxID=28002 RepID=A0AA86R1K4_9EUKA|nr:Hypothetical protein HINF_LOCUS57634 [Hexamita inflata]
MHHIVNQVQAAPFCSSQLHLHIINSAVISGVQLNNTSVYIVTDTIRQYSHIHYIICSKIDQCNRNAGIQTVHYDYVMKKVQPRQIIIVTLPSRQSARRRQRWIRRARLYN